jgi:DNA-binding Lrp family transcriptional regulator
MHSRNELSRLDPIPQFTPAQIPAQSPKDDGRQFSTLSPACRFDAFAQAIKRMPGVQECPRVAGGFDYLIKARVKDMSAYREFLGEFLGESLTRLPGVRQTHPCAVTEEVKNSIRLSL